MMKHTKGNWHLDGDVIRSDKAKNWICQIGWMNNNHEEDANAKLIAAAPELLAILKEAVDLKYLSEYSDQDGLTQRAIDAITNR
jgi:hypothetical protein